MAEGEINDLDISLSQISSDGSIDQKILDIKKKLKPYITKRSTQKALITNALKKLVGDLDPDFVLSEVSDINVKRKSLRYWIKTLLLYMRTVIYFFKFKVFLRPNSTNNQIITLISRNNLVI